MECDKVCGCPKFVIYGIAVAVAYCAYRCLV